MKEKIDKEINECIQELPAILASLKTKLRCDAENDAVDAKDVADFITVIKKLKELLPENAQNNSVLSSINSILEKI